MPQARPLPPVEAPATCVVGDVYVSSSEGTYACTATNTWTIVPAGASGCPPDRHAPDGLLAVVLIVVMAVGFATGCYFKAVQRREE